MKKKRKTGKITGFFQTNAIDESDRKHSQNNVMLPSEKNEAPDKTFIDEKYK